MTTAIRYVVFQSHLDNDGSTTDDQAAAYGRDLATALRTTYPDREVRVEVRRRVQGVGAGLQGEPEGVDAAAVERLAELVWERGLCSEPGCGQIRGTAKGLCPTHYQQRRRTGATRPVRRPAAGRIGVRLSAAALQALGDHPAERAREVLEAWAAGRRGLPG